MIVTVVVICLTDFSNAFVSFFLLTKKNDMAQAGHTVRHIIHTIHIWDSQKYIDHDWLAGTEEEIKLNLQCLRNVSLFLKKKSF